MRALSIALVLVFGACMTSEARADEPRRPRLELTAGGGLAWLSTDPSALDPTLGGQLVARAFFDLDLARADLRFVWASPLEAGHLQVRGDARLIFATVHDFTYRQNAHGTMTRLLAGLGGDLDLPDGYGHIGMSVGFAMLHLEPQHDAAFSEAYGAYAGISLRLLLGPIRDELRVALHAMTRPPELGLDTTFDSILDGFEPGVTVSNRFFMEVLQGEGFVLGPELDVQVEQLLEGLVFQSTLSLVGGVSL